MINADERKKLLEQIAALEHNSINYFDVEREFFLIDSDNLSKIQTRFYGYSIQADGIYEESNLTPDAVKNLDGRGCYVYIEVEGEQITVKQDLNSSWGIYLFRRGDYFALSNSFFRLLDHVKFRYPLTVNRDYCHYLMVNGFCSHAYSETAVNEIALVDRNAILHIDVEKRILQTEFIDYKEQSVALDSAEGIATLDSWADFWGKVFRGVISQTKFTQVDLSGGFDSRISFALLLNSGADLNKVRINSTEGNLHTYKEDFAIASQIANHYGLKLNQPFPDEEFLNYSLNDALNANLYLLQTVHKDPAICLQKFAEKHYHIRGFGGEIIRSYWYGSLQKFAESEIRLCTYSYSSALGLELSISVKNILEATISHVCRKYNITSTLSPYITQYLYQETRCRHHFGKIMTGKYFENAVTLAPTLDPKVQSLKLEIPDWPDPNLLMALIFARYEPALLKFPFEGKRSINPETLALAQKLNERFPRRLTTDKVDVGGGHFHLQPHDKHTEKILASEQNNEAVSRELFYASLKTAFESSRTYGLFNMYFNSELYRYALAHYNAFVFGRIRYLHSVLGIAKVLEDVEISRRNHTQYRDMERFIEEDFCRIL